MDEKGATHIDNAPAPLAAEPEPDQAPGGTPMYLIVLSGGIPGAMLGLSPGGNWLGRAADNSVQFPDPSISRRHALLRADDTGRVRLTDLGSTNGTFLNGRRLPPHQPRALADGDRVRIGSAVVVKFVRPDPCEERFQRAVFDRVTRDDLTGLYNRAYFFDRVVPLARTAALKGLGLAVLMLDIDHFKAINDAHGHDAGDAILREVAAVLRQATRSDDLVARYGGEEFVLAVPVASPARAVERAELIRTMLAGRTLRAPVGPLRVTVSIGVAFAPADCPRSSAALVSTADLHLYRAKESGRDRVCYLGLDESQEGQITVDDESVGPTRLVPSAPAVPRLLARSGPQGRG